jgi:hypothetical protein
LMRIDHQKRELSMLIQSLLIASPGLMIMRFTSTIAWMPAILLSGLIAIIFMATKNYICYWRSKWKGKKLPEVQITDCMAMMNSKPVPFRNSNCLLRTVEVKEYKTINILEITYEKSTRRGMVFDELRIPVPKGKLREAVEVQGSLHLRCSSAGVES